MTTTAVLPSPPFATPGISRHTRPIALSCSLRTCVGFGAEVSPDARRPPLLIAENIPANRQQRVDDATYARNALTAARDAARSVSW